MEKEQSSPNAGHSARLSKNVACLTCRKSKIKCRMVNPNGPCERCKKRNLSCTVSKNLQALLEGDASWKETVEERLSQLEAAQAKHPVRPSTTTHLSPATDPGTTTGEAPVRYTSHQANNDHNQDGTLDLSCSLGAFPASSMKATPTPRAPLVLSPPADPTLSGVLSERQMRVHFDFYRENLDRYLHYLLSEQDTMEIVGARSPVLLNAICTAAAFCTGSPDFKPCVTLMKDAVSRLLFSPVYHFDDVLALCIGALWVREISAACHGLAVRIGASLDLHRCVTKMPHTKRNCYDRTRLHYIVCLVDHHCSLTFGRPPMTNEWTSLRSPRTFLQSLHCKALDFGLISQIEFWAISRRVFESFGADVERNFEAEMAGRVEDLAKEYERWHADWTDVLAIRNQDDGESRRTFELYYNCAKLSLLSHIFRGRPRSEAVASALLGTLEQQALEAALATIRCAFVEDDAGVWLQTLPTYFGTVISFACLFLVKVIRGEGPQVKQELIDESLGLIRRVAKTQQVSPTGTAVASQLHSVVQATEVPHAHNVAAENPIEAMDNTFTSMDFDFDQLMDTTFDWSLPGFDDSWMCAHEAQLDII